MQYSAGLTRVNANVLCRLRQRPISGRDDRIYELGDERLAKDAFLDAYLSSAFRYLPFTEAQRVILATEKDQHVADAKRFILEGVMENTPIWRKKASDAPLRPSVAPP